MCGLGADYSTTPTAGTNIPTASAHHLQRWACWYHSTLLKFEHVSCTPFLLQVLIYSSDVSQQIYLGLAIYTLSISLPCMFWLSILTVVPHRHGETACTPYNLTEGHHDCPPPCRPMDYICWPDPYTSRLSASWERAPTSSARWVV